MPMIGDFRDIVHYVLNNKPHLIRGHFQGNEALFSSTYLIYFRQNKFFSNNLFKTK